MVQEKQSFSDIVKNISQGRSIYSVGLTNDLPSLLTVKPNEEELYINPSLIEAEEDKKTDVISSLIQRGNLISRLNINNPFNLRENLEYEHYSIMTIVGVEWGHINYNLESEMYPEFKFRSPDVCCTYAHHIRSMSDPSLPSPKNYGCSRYSEVKEIFRKAIAESKPIRRKKYCREITAIQSDYIQNNIEFNEITPFPFMKTNWYNKTQNNSVVHGNKSEKSKSASESSSRELKNNHIIDIFERSIKDELIREMKSLPPSKNKYSACSGTRLNTRKYIRNISGDESERRIFSTRKTSPNSERCMIVCLDASSSIDEKMSKLAVFSLSEACNQMDDDIIIVFYNTNKDGIETGVISSFDEDFKPRHLDRFTNRGQTPMASGLELAREKSNESFSQETFVVVISDGEANVCKSGRKYTSNERGEASSQAMKEVEKACMENSGVILLNLNTQCPHYLKEAFNNSVYSVSNQNELPKVTSRIYKDICRS